MGFFKVITLKRNALIIQKTTQHGPLVLEEEDKRIVRNHAKKR